MGSGENGQTNGNAPHCGNIMSSGMEKQVLEVMQLQALTEMVGGLKHLN